ncbi:MAG: toluene monooxygenase system protein [Actinomycetota bacterium]|nr:toluene monooxygenase system protein [Actinomycetota bacterium]
MATRQRQQPKTWSLLGDVRRRPSAYEAVTAKFHYHFRREPTPFEHPGMPLNDWYLRNREGSPFQVDDWEDFRDPYKLTYKDYVALQHDRETYVDKLIDRHEESASVEGLSDEWVSTLRELYIPLRFPLHILQMVGLYVGQMAPSAYITNCANFQAADELRRIQRIAYSTKMLANAHGDELAATATARSAWEKDPVWQPLRETLENLLIAYDWGEAFVALNLVVKPSLDAVVNWRLSELAERNGDHFLAALLAEFQQDSNRSRKWSADLAQYALGRQPDLRQVMEGWTAAWTPRIEAAVKALAQPFDEAPVGLAATDVVSATGTQARDHLQACGL